MQRPVDDIEIKNAAFSMGAFKAPKLDGSQAHFFQSQWDVVGDKVYTMIKDMFQNSSVMSKVNFANIILIPKVDYPTFPQGDATYIFIFIVGRSSCDNIIIAQEIIQQMKTKLGRKGFATIKTPFDKPFILLVDNNLDSINPNDVVSRFVLPSGGWNIYEWLGSNGIAPTIRVTGVLTNGHGITPLVMFVGCFGYRGANMSLKAQMVPFEATCKRLVAVSLEMIKENGSFVSKEAWELILGNNNSASR
ncbi:uncharacterized protein LOC129308879 [Prosopis cineraria]|uniref:uncharacterized protein LOC129308879 n=1 Tax=Prosopis cineraria TaxID=364024 RepID=UPI00240EBE26|nr:uncharacterized protein LOC129308879 [Prosopis cineraria]